LHYFLYSFHFLSHSTRKCCDVRFSKTFCS
jgi:hypothetical protein